MSEALQMQKDHKEKKRQLDMKKSVEKSGHLLVLLFLFCFAIVYPLYFRDGYTQITTYKFQYLKIIAFLFGGLLLIVNAFYLLIPSKMSDGAKVSIGSRVAGSLKNLSATDIFILLYGAVLIFSFMLSDFPQEALWGTDGWYMGFVTQMICIGIYYFVSRFYDGKESRIWYLMGISFLIFLWGLLNRFSIYPITMENASVEYISSIGNINWFCGYWSVFFVMGPVIYILTEDMASRIFSGIYSMVALGLAAVEGSDSAFVSLGIVFFLLFLVCFEKRRWLERYLEIIAIMTGTWQVFRLIHYLFPEQLNFWNITISFVLGNATLIVFIMAVLLRVIIDDPEKETLHKAFHIVKWVVVSAVILLLAGYIILLIMNTRSRGNIGSLSDNGLFIFDSSWGSSRGMTWKDGILIFNSFPGWRKWVGAGPDCFTMYAYTHPAISYLLENQFGGVRLTNAHNEMITILVNTGILGLLTFLGIFISSIVRHLRKMKQNPMCLIIAVSAISYLFHNIFSFQQIVNTPFAFLMLGLGENILRKESSYKRKQGLERSEAD